MKINLLFPAILLVTSVDRDLNSRSIVKQFLNDQMKYVRLKLRGNFLQQCVDYKVIPKFIEDHIRVPGGIQEKEAITRKATSLKMEVLRQQLKEVKEEEKHSIMRRGHGYLHLVRRWSEDMVRELLKRMETAIRETESTALEKHTKKWKKWTNQPYPVPPEQYVIDFRPVYPFPYVDSFLLPAQVHNSTSDVLNTDESGPRENKIQTPSYVNDVLAKGPNYRLPIKLDENTITNAEKELDKLTYSLRWRNVYKDESGDISQRNNLVIPFKKNTIKLPPKLEEESETNLKLFKAEVLNVIKTEVGKTEKSNSKRIRNNLKKTKRFLNKNNLTVAPTDKSNKLIVIDNNDLISETEKILQDSETYRRLDKSRISNTENQANKLLKSICKTKMSQKELEKLLSCGSNAAKFSVTIKDHKEMTDGFYPLRPIASCRNNPTEKLDWFISKFLLQLIQYVPANLKNAEDLIEKLKEVHLNNSYSVFISLDVKNLYPSIPLQRAITEVVNFAKIHWCEINNYGVNPEEMEKMLRFICYNYEIAYNNKTYLQIKGCPMGAHFSPPFAIIYLHSLETKALKNLKDNLQIVPQIYGRYIDDIIIGPFDKYKTNFTDILESFNSIDSDIKFTIEIPENKSLNFLDITIITETDQQVQYTWFKKPQHSDVSIAKDSFLPQHTKTNFLRNSTDYVKKRCSNDVLMKFSERQLHAKFRKNGFCQNDWKKANQKKNNRPNSSRDKNTCSFLKLNYINDCTDRKIRKLIQRYKIPAKLVNKSNQTIYNNLRFKSKQTKHPNCEICDRLPDRILCTTRHLVYKFTCHLCNDFYIGQSNRPFKFRFNEHCRSLLNKNKNNSALAEHVLQKHHSVNCTIDDFDLSIIDKCNDPVDTRLTEARYIKRLSPQINRKHELIDF